jgi:predicted flavoprotein YhiN
LGDGPAREVVVVGAGAAGTFAAIAARGAVDSRGARAAAPADAPRVLLRDGRDPPGRKILVSGGGRCNAGPTRVSERDFVSDAPPVVRTLLAGFPPSSVQAFFRALGIEFLEEPGGKWFPRSGGARGVRDTLLRAASEAGVETDFRAPVASVERVGDRWQVDGAPAERVIVATGGLSVPSTGSDGFGLALARRLGHAVVEPVPALAPLWCEVPAALAGVTLPAIVTASDADGRVLRRAAGALLFTHRGVTGPAAFDVSGVVARRLAEKRAVRVHFDFWTLAAPDGPWSRFLGLPKPPGVCLPDAPAPSDAAAVERALLDATAESPRLAAGSVLARRLPRRLVDLLVPAAATSLANLSREDRRAAARAVAAYEPALLGAGGFDRAEVTEGGVPLRELDRRTLESRLAPGLHFCGEVCNATGRLGGFNFQWAWASGLAAGRGAAAATRVRGPEGA